MGLPGHRDVQPGGPARPHKRHGTAVEPFEPRIRTAASAAPPHFSKGCRVPPRHTRPSERNHKRAATLQAINHPRDRIDVMWVSAGGSTDPVGTGSVSGSTGGTHAGGPGAEELSRSHTATVGPMVGAPASSTRAASATSRLTACIRLSPPASRWKLPLRLLKRWAVSSGSCRSRASRTTQPSLTVWRRPGCCGTVKPR